MCLFKHEKLLFHPVGIERPNPQYAALLQEQLGGGNGELKAAMQYMSQSFRIKDPKIKDLFMDIAAEELSHMEMVAQTINLLNGHNVEADKVQAGEIETHVLLGLNPGLINASGYSWTADYVTVTGDLCADLLSNIASEQRAKVARELLKACKAQGWDTAIETTAYGTDEAIEAVIPYVDLVLMDCKSTDPEVHKRVTGVSNEKIRKNAAKIVKMANKVIIRVPTIPTVNAFEEEFHRIAEFAKSLGVDTVHVLPYHTLGESKYEMLGKAYTMGYEIKSLPRDEAEVFRQVVLSHGLNCVVGG